MSKEPWLFNGSKFRLHSFFLVSPTRNASSCVSSEHPPCIHSASFSTVGPDEEQDRGSNSREQTERAKGDFCPRVSDQNSLDNRNRPVNQDKNTDDQELVPPLTLRLGLTCYKDYLGTNWSRRVAELRQLGETEFGDPLALLAQPLGVGAILCTDDDQVVLIRRSQRVAEAGGLLDIPGGHPEPKVE